MKKLTKRTDGRYVKCITDPRTKKRVYFYGKTEKEINRKLLEYQTKEKNGRTFEEVAKEWYKINVSSWALSTQSSYKTYMNEILKEFGKMNIRDILPSDIAKYFVKSAKADEGKAVVEMKKSIIQNIFKYSVIQNDISFSPCPAVSLPKGLRTTKRTAVSPETEDIIKKSPHVWIVPYIALMTGCRKGEILALQMKDVDFKSKTISVTKNAIYSCGHFIISTPKTKTSIRTVPLLKPFETILKEYSDNPEIYLSTGTDKLIAPHEYRIKLEEFQIKTGTQFTLHQLRHSFATIAMENGLSPKTVQELLGHSDIHTTLSIYTDVRKKAIDEAYVTLNNALK